MYRCMLVPLDGSRFAEHALTLARPLARKCGARLHLVLAHTPIAAHAVDVAPPRVFHDWEDAHRARERGYLDRVAERLRSEGVDAEAEFREGDTVRELLECAEADVDLVVLATHGRGGFERAWMGSVADDLLRHLHVPVLTIRPMGQEPPAGDRVFRHVLAATDGSKAADAAVEHATRIARLYGARLTLLRVVPMPAGLGSPYIPHTAEADREVADQREDEARHYLRWLASQIETGEVVATLVTRAYQPARGILAEAADIEADLIVLGTHRRFRLARAVLGSVADTVVRGASVPVLVAHADDAPAGRPDDPVVA